MINIFSVVSEVYRDKSFKPKKERFSGGNIYDINCKLQESLLNLRSDTFKKILSEYKYDEDKIYTEVKTDIQ